MKETRIPLLLAVIRETSRICDVIYGHLLWVASKSNSYIVFRFVMSQATPMNDSWIIGQRRHAPQDSLHSRMRCNFVNLSVIAQSPSRVGRMRLCGSAVLAVDDMRTRKEGAFTFVGLSVGAARAFCILGERAAAAKFGRALPVMPSLKM